MKTYKKLFLFLSLILLTGCQNICNLSSFNFSPKMRIGSVPSPSFWTRFPEPDALGTHSYNYSFSERNGILYTCLGGHIDLVHLRSSADWTAYLAARSYSHMIGANPELTFKVTEPSVYTVSFQYPDGWASLPSHQRQHIASLAAVDLGQYLTYVACVWHEIITWYGFKWTGVYNEHQSAFSWEDMYSNAVGINIAATALRSFPDQPFDEIMTGLINHELTLLSVQSAFIARQTAASVREKRGSQMFVSTDMKIHNFDIGLDDGFITPLNIPAKSGCDPQNPAACPIPSSDLSKYGIKVIVRIQPREWERHEILKAAYQTQDPPAKYIDPDIHFANIISDIIRQAETKYAANYN